MFGKKKHPSYKVQVYLTCKRNRKMLGEENNNWTLNIPMANTVHLVDGHCDEMCLEGGRDEYVSPGILSEETLR